MPAVIDTGAARTVLTPEAINKVGLQKVDEIKLLRLGGETIVGVYVASIQFPNENLTTIEMVEVAGCELPGQVVQCLIGRDIISRWLFTYNGPEHEWSIEEEEVGKLVEPPEGIDE